MADIELKISVIAKQSPKMENVKPKAIAGLTEKQLIERHTIGEYVAEESEEQSEI